MTDPATNPQSPGPAMPDYKGAPLDAERGPGLGCFWIQIVLLVALLILTPLSVLWAWPSMLSAGLLIATLLLLLFAGQTIIFLLRLVAADRRSRRRPLREGASPTVGQLEDGGATDSEALVDPAGGEREPRPLQRPEEIPTSQVVVYFGLAVLYGILIAILNDRLGYTLGLVVGLVVALPIAVYLRRELPTLTTFARLLWVAIAIAASLAIGQFLFR